MMSKTIIHLHLSPISSKWAFHHLGQYSQTSFFRKQLRKMLELLMEPRPIDYKEKEYDHASDVIIRLPSDIKPNRREVRSTHHWIPPKSMKILDEMISQMWRHELAVWVMTKSRIDGVKEIDVIYDFIQLYDIADEELGDEMALKIVQRAKKKLSRFFFMEMSGA